MILLNIHMQIYCRRDSRGIDVQFDLTSLPALFVARYKWERHHLLHVQAGLWLLLLKLQGVVDLPRFAWIKNNSSYLRCLLPPPCLRRCLARNLPLRVFMHWHHHSRQMCESVLSAIAVTAALLTLINKQKEEVEKSQLNSMVPPT